MRFNLDFLPTHRSQQLLRSVWEVSSGWVTDGGPSASRGWLRRFLLLKLVTVLLFPHRAFLPLAAGCVLSLRALSVLRSPHISTKPSTVFLGQLALSDGLVLLRWLLRLGAAAEEEGGVRTLCEQLLEAHHLASLLLLGLLGLEAALLSRWPLQTRPFRTSHWAQLSCGLVWMLVLLELTLTFHPRLLQDLRPQSHFSATQDSPTSSVGLLTPSSLPAFSPCLRRTLWLINLWLHYTFLYGKPQRRKSSFH